MANLKQLRILKQGATIWNEWRTKADSEKIDLRYADLRERDLAKANLREADLRGADLRKANLYEADLTSAVLRESDLGETNLFGANLQHADLRDANLTGASLTRAYLLKANLHKANLTNANLTLANLTLSDLGETQLLSAHLVGANLSEANLVKADISWSDLMGADLREANLQEANLTGANLVRTKIDKAILSGSEVYAVNVWDLEGEFEQQKDLVISPYRTPTITVDNIKVAQFIYLILNNKEIRDVINTLTSKSVLILGRFAIPERKAILDALRNKLREYNLLPIVFDFDRPTDKDFTETIKTLAGLSYFVIADVTNPRSSPLELQATVPDYQVPFVPIIQEGEQPFAMMVDLQKKYPWVLDTLTYDSIDTLINALKPAIIDPAIEKHNELRLIKAREPKIRSAKDFLEK